MRRFLLLAAIAVFSIVGSHPSLGDFAPKAQAANKQKCNITMTRVSGPPNTVVAVKVYLKDLQGRPIRNRTVSITETSSRGVTCFHRPTDAEGKVVWNYVIQQLGNPTTLKAHFNGDTVYYSDSITRNVNITN